MAKSKKVTIKGPKGTRTVTSGGKAHKRHLAAKKAGKASKRKRK